MTGNARIKEKRNSFFIASALTVIFGTLAKYRFSSYMINILKRHCRTHIEMKVIQWRKNSAALTFSTLRLRLWHPHPRTFHRWDRGNLCRRIRTDWGQSRPGQIQTIVVWYEQRQVLVRKRGGSQLLERRQKAQTEILSWTPPFRWQLGQIIWIKNSAPVIAQNAGCWTNDASFKYALHQRYCPLLNS